jgi:CRISPR system Cascade subunit CasA
MNQTTEPDTQTLWGNLLEEPLLHYRRVGSGERIACTLPELFIAMAHDQVRDFPALRPHQRHPWHAFLVQLAAIALHRAERTEPFATAQEWQTAFLALTPDDPDGAAWCLVSPVRRPAFMQAPVAAWTEAEWETLSTAADEIDVLKASKNHDLKKRRMTNGVNEDWVFALVSLQTQSPSDSGSYAESSRVAGGYARRPGIGIAPPGGICARWKRDLKVLLQARSTIVEKFSLNEEGTAITWLAQWSGAKNAIFGADELDPFYIEITRRIRLFSVESSVQARTAKTPNARISSVTGALTGDIWSPIQFAKKEGDTEKIFTLRKGGFSYRTAAQFVFPGNVEFSPAMKLQVSDSVSGLQVVMQSIAVGENNVNHGYHERRVAISKKTRQGLVRQADELAELSNQRVFAIQAVTEMLDLAMMVLFQKSLQFPTSEKEFFAEVKRFSSFGKKPAPVKERASLFAQPFEAECDAQFFLELTEEIEAEDRDAVRRQWLCDLADLAERVLRSAFDAGPRSGQLRYRAQSAALERLRWQMRSDKSKLPALAQALKTRYPTPSRSTREENHEHA